MKQFATSISVRAERDAIWALLTDAAGYPVWNSTVENLVGTIAPGETITVYTRPSAGRAFPIKVTAFSPPDRMVWTGGMPLGLFSGTRVFSLGKEPDGAVRFAMEETYSGLLAPLITRSIPDLQPAFDRFAADLKARAESLAALPSDG